jgi:LmbE family N-acetylglucosaminyl deacetylase
MTIATPDCIDVGWSYRLTPDKTRLVLVSQAHNENWPPDDLLVLNGERGEFGKLRVDHPDLGKYENGAVELVKSFLGDRTLIVLPELSGSLAITEAIKKLLDESNKHCIVVAGSYYRDAANGRIEHVCPILIPKTRIHYQQKFVPAAIENSGFDPVDRRVIKIFQHTGFGDFATLVCSDAIDHGARQSYVNVLRHQIDFLVVPARNPAPQLPESLQTLSDNERWCVLYCNGNKTHASQVISCYSRRSEKGPTLFNESATITATIDLERFQKDLQDGDGLHRCTEQERYFDPSPRHWPYRGLRAFGFSDHLRVVAIGSHFDDVWLGCSGSLMRLQECHNAQIRVVTLCNAYPWEYYDRYKLEGATRDQLYGDLDELCRKLGFRHEQYQGTVLEDQSFDEDRVHDFMKELHEKAGDVDLLFVPRQDDVHRDHMVTAKAAMVKFRGTNVFEYEIKDFRRSPFRPNLLVDLGIRSNRDLGLAGIPWQGTTFADKKAFILENAFRIMDASDLPFVVQKEHTLGRMTFRASQSGTELTHAEAFVAEMII